MLHGLCFDLTTPILFPFFAFLLSCRFRVGSVSLLCWVGLIFGPVNQFDPGVFVVWPVSDHLVGLKIFQDRIHLVLIDAGVTGEDA